MTLGITADIGAAGTTHGITEDTGEADGTTPVFIRITDGTTLTGVTITTTALVMSLITTRTYGTDRDIRQALTDSSPAHRPSEEVSEAEARSAETSLPAAQHRLYQETQLPEALL